MMKKIVVTALIVTLSLIPNPVVPGKAGVATAAQGVSGKMPEAGDEGLEEFVPSEKVSADSSISFPVDI